MTWAFADLGIICLGHLIVSGHAELGDQVTRTPEHTRPQTPNLT